MVDGGRGLIRFFFLGGGWKTWVIGVCLRRRSSGIPFFFLYVGLFELDT